MFMTFVRKGTQNLRKSSCLLEPKVHGKALQTNSFVCFFEAALLNSHPQHFWQNHYCLNILTKDFLQLKLLKLYERRINKSHFFIC